MSFQTGIFGKIFGRQQPSKTANFKLLEWNSLMFWWKKGEGFSRGFPGLSPATPLVSMMLLDVPVLVTRE